MRLCIRLDIEDNDFHLHTSIDNNMHNLIKYHEISPVRYISSNRIYLMWGSISHGRKPPWVCKKVRWPGSSTTNLCLMITTFVDHRGREIRSCRSYERQEDKRPPPTFPTETRRQDPADGEIPARPTLQSFPARSRPIQTISEPDVN
ncbi:hypothetical protein M5K25_009976 [Dendrobium thyrsiflorum]|uniref:Uncharacterized protein n=1 Tax=Dendrobium thyrsiflorum TaxID=117978 RepID=A0ABD0V7R9_DENTH